MQAKCEYFNVCGGCAKQDLEPAAQLANKQQELLELLGDLKPLNIAEPLTGPIWGYRTKARLGVRFVPKKDKVLVGFRERKARYIADMDQCEILHPSIGKIIKELKDLLRGLDCYNTIAQIEVAVGDDQLALIFRNVEELSNEARQALIEFAKLKEFELYLQPGGLDTIHKIYPSSGAERLAYTLPQHDLRMEFHPIDFTQVNPDLNRKMINQALDWMDIKSDDRVLDLFCGLGNFTLPMARRAEYVTGVEGASAMVERGYENAKNNNISNVDFYAADLTKDFAQHSWADKKYNKVLLDPPRSGAEDILEYIANLNVDTVLYVSCGPASLARDAKILTEKYGFTLDKIGIMDMFPHTMHVESMALFKNGKST